MTLYEVEVNGNKLGWDHIWENKTDAQKEVDYYKSVGLSARVIVLAAHPALPAPRGQGLEKPI